MPKLTEPRILRFGVPVGLFALAMGWTGAVASMRLATSPGLAIPVGATGVVAACLGIAKISTSLSGSDESALFRSGYPAVLALYYGVASLGWVVTSIEIPGLTRQNLAPHQIAPAFVVVLVAISSWLGGYLLGRYPGVRWLKRLRDHSLPQRTSEALPKTSSVLIIYLLGILGRVVTIVQGKFWYISQDVVGSASSSTPLLSIVSRLEMMASVGSLLAAYLLARQPNVANRLLLWSVLGLEVSFGLLSGMRSEVLLILVSVGAVIWQLRGRPSVRALLALTLVIMVLVPFTSAYRDFVRQGNRTGVTTSEAAAAIPPIMASAIADVTPLDAFGTPIEFVLDRFRGIDGIAVVRLRTPSEIPFVPVEQTVAEPILGLIPRFLWHDKPVYTTGLQFARDYLGQNEAVISASTPTQIGDLYRRGGVWSVAVGMALVGLLCRMFARVLTTRGDPRAVVLAIPILLALANMESDFLILPLALVQTVIITGFACRLAFRSTRRVGQGYGRANFMGSSHV